MPSLCLYFKVHQPYSLKPYHAAEIDKVHCYEDAIADKNNINKVADECYLPANKILLEAIKASGNHFKVAFSISGVTIELLQKYRPDVLDSFRELVDTGCADIIGETYYHSLSFLHSEKEFERQVLKHRESIENIFGIPPVVFRNTELIYNNQLAATIAALGFKGILCEGIDRLLQGRNENKLYAAPGIENDFSVLLRNMQLSDDIAFRFAEEGWDKHPLTAGKFAEWIFLHPADTQVINIFLDYETFGIHKPAVTGIFDFLKALPAAMLNNSEWKFSTPAEAVDEYYPTDIYDVEKTISWKDQEKESCVWCENMMQNNTLKKVYSLARLVMQSDDEHIKNTWGRLQAADYFYYMNDSACSGISRRYQNPFSSAQQVFQYYSRILTDFEISLIKKALGRNAAFQYSSVGLLY